MNNLNKSAYKRQERWHQKHLKTVSCRAKIQAQQAFAGICAQAGKSVHRALLDYVTACIRENRLVIPESTLHRRNRDRFRSWEI